MAKNKLTDLNDHLFAQLERLNDEEITPEQTKLEVEKAKAISIVAGQILKTSKITLDAMKLVNNGIFSMDDVPVNIGLKKLELKKSA